MVIMVEAMGFMVINANHSRDWHVTKDMVRLY